MSVTRTAGATPVLEESEVLEAVRSVRAVVEANGEAAERERTLPRDVVDALANRGLFALRAPRAVGGSEVHPLVALAAYEEMTSYDTSAGWSMAIANGGVGVLGARLDDDSVDEVFGAGVPLVAGSFAPTGTATAIGGGYRVSGRWGFASGIRHANWLTAGCMTDSTSGPASMISVVVPRDAARLIDDWHVAGLQGTGSCDWEAVGLDVPERRVIRQFDPPRRGGPGYTIPLFAFLGVEHAGFALGCARRSLEEVVAGASEKVRLLSSSSVATRSAFQRDVGRAEAAVRAARLLVVDVVGESWETAARGEEVTSVAEAEIRVAATHATEVAVDVCTMAFRYLGAHALHARSVVQRYFRDINAAAQHVYVSDTTFESLARVRLGLDG